MSIKIIHCADNHLRDSQYARTSRRDDFIRAFSSIVDIALDNSAHAVLCCGDVFNSVRISPYLQRAVTAIHLKCLRHRLPFYVISGNHDLTEPHWIESVRRPADDEEYGLVFLNRERATIPGTDLTVFGAPAMGREEFLEAAPTWPAADIHMWHGMVYDFLPELAARSGSGLHLHEIGDVLKKCNFLALGDLHIRAYDIVGPDGTVREKEPSSDDDGRTTIQLPTGHCLVGYPGSTELCYANEATSKSVTLVEFDDNGFPEALSAIPVKHRKYLKFNIMHEEQIEEVIAQIGEHSADDPPVVILYYNPNIGGVKERIRAAIPGPEKLMQSIPTVKKDQDASNIKSSIEGDAKTPEDFVHEFVEEGTAAATLGRQLLNPDPDLDTNALVDDYIHKRKSELGVA